MPRSKRNTAQQPDLTVDHQPFPTVSPAALLAHNALYRRRQPLMTEVRGRPLSVGLSGRPWVTSDTSRSFVVSAGIWNFQLDLPGSLVEELMDGLCKPGSFHGLSSLHQAILIEAVLEDLLSPFEAAVLKPIQFVADANLHAADIKLDLNVALSSFEGIVRLVLNPEASKLISKAWDGLSSHAPLDLKDLPVPIQLLAGAQTLSVAEISALQPGDTIMSEGGTPGELYALCAGQLQARCIQSEQGAVLTSGWSTATISRPEGNEIFVERGTAMDEGAIDNLSVRVIFELARTDMSLREVKELAEGSIVPVAAISEGAVSILANGSKIGRGDIVRLGEGLGVRILQLGAND
ncbi:FliM/FliN family flagellar motor switch protein [Phyllobacterium sp. P30BS-XVII]|uniref:FliM/FliN family flagellar motor switch protein n=1 Tax=Phyllobacterium sp. P30BS-XVII TaxID=2587046 RepID=UPI0015FBA556|nr:FliM/FliN family flagellar motor switch protein [Phyllobacterium sp. P30BS-XVII]MBA8901664.1 type III secretion protein Q [Phyllobacterium sp. P30BS-XVII]